MYLGTLPTLPALDGDLPADMIPSEQPTVLGVPQKTAIAIGAVLLILLVVLLNDRD